MIRCHSHVDATIAPRPRQKKSGDSVFLGIFVGEFSWVFLQPLTGMIVRSIGLSAEFKRP